MNLRVHRNSLGVHLSNLLKKGDQDDEEWGELNFDSDSNDNTTDSGDVPESSAKGLKHLVLKHLSKIGNNKKSGRKLLVTFDLHSLTRDNRRDSKVSTATSGDSEKDISDNTDEEESNRKSKFFASASNKSISSI